MSRWIKFALLLAAIGAVVAAWSALTAYYVHQGDVKGAARVQGRWDAQVKVDQAETLRLQQQANAELLLKVRNSERNAHEQNIRMAATARRDAAARAAVSSLRSTIDALNQRDVSSPNADPGAAGLAADAALARELLGSCSEAYRELAKAADGLRDQVTGLLADANDVCRASAR